MATESKSMLHEVTLTAARNLSPIFDEAVRARRPVMIVRGHKERGLLVAEDSMRRLLAAYTLHVDIIPEETGRFTLWLRELNVTGGGASLREARKDLVSAVRSYVDHYRQESDWYRHVPEKVAQEPYVLLVSLAKDDDDISRMLFGDEAAGQRQTPRELAPA